MSFAFQATLQPPRYYALENLPAPPCPAAVIGFNGLYDLPALVHELDASHEHLRDEYELLLSVAFGEDERGWSAPSPALFDSASLAERVQEGEVPRLVVLDQSTDDQLVPINQKLRLETNLYKVSGLRVVAGHRCAGKHAAPWEQGFMIWNGLRDALANLQEMR